MGEGSDHLPRVSSAGGKAQEISQYIPNIPESTCLVMVEDNVMFGALQGHSEVWFHIHQDHLKEDDLTKW